MYTPYAIIMSGYEAFECADNDSEEEILGPDNDILLHGLMYLLNLIMMMNLMNMLHLQYLIKTNSYSETQKILLHFAS